MKILFVAPFLSYPNVPYAGESIIFNLIKGLSSRGHALYLITGLRPGDKAHLGEIKPYCTVLDVIETPWTRRELFRDVLNWAGRGFSGGLTVRKRAALAVQKFSEEIGFDVLMVEHTAMGEYITKPGSTAVVIAAHDVLLKPALREYQLAKGIKKIVKYIAYKRTVSKEIALYRRYDLVFTLSDFDRQLLSTFSRNLHIETRLPHIACQASNPAIGRESTSILYVGAMDRPVNAQAALFFSHLVLPLVQKEIPEASFWIVGNKPTLEISALSDERANIVVTGYVDDLKPFYAKARIFAAPLFIGGGIITKILDAMAAGVPVITTRVGNEGINAEPGSDLLIAETPIEFAQESVRLMRDEVLWQRLSENGKKFIQRHFSEEQMLAKVEKTLLALKK